MLLSGQIHPQMVKPAFLSGLFRSGRQVAHQSSRRRPCRRPRAGGCWSCHPHTGSDAMKHSTLPPLVVNFVPAGLVPSVQGARSRSAARKLSANC